ncbi:hypothetical protein V5O48_008491 [Marasmius crinis-equi]|uniref:Uncharacterized protein n=1 Tax=Marasmius crinis-equi TaxID=585013 RepID=A0ABR3FDR4_9AGAR
MFRVHRVAALSNPAQCIEPTCPKDLIWDDIQTVTRTAVLHHEHVLDCVAGGFIKSEFKRGALRSGLTTYKLLWNLYPLFQWLRVHPQASRLLFPMVDVIDIFEQLVLVLRNDDSPILVEAIFVFDHDDSADLHSPRGVFELQVFEAYTIYAFGFELVWALDYEHFNAGIAVTAPALRSWPYLQ